MGEFPTSRQTPSLLAVTIRRSMVIGRFSLLFGTGYSVLLAAILAYASGPGFVSSDPLFLPIFSVAGSLGALMVFTNDRLKGVFEYLIAYGISPRRLFVNVLLASLALVTIVVCVTLAVGFGVYLSLGHVVPFELVEVLCVYSIPMSYACAAFSATVGVFWTSLSSPRAGMSSPLGLMPIIGIAPSVVTLIAAEADPTLEAPIIVGGVIAVVLAVVTLLRLIGRLMPPERLLSPA